VDVEASLMVLLGFMLVGLVELVFYGAIVNTVILVLDFGDLFIVDLGLRVELDCLSGNHIDNSYYNK